MSDKIKGILYIVVALLIALAFGVTAIGKTILAIVLLSILAVVVLVLLFCIPEFLIRGYKLLKK